MKNLEFEGLKSISNDEAKEVNGGIDPITFWAIATGVMAAITLADYAAKEIQTGYEIYQKSHK